MLNIVLILLIVIFSVRVHSQPIALHPDNPHYFIYKGKPMLLITSAEHYGAVLNIDFDYATYLQTLHDQGMNYTRIFTGSYVEIPGSFNIQNNTLAPAVCSFLAPWKRIAEAGLYEEEKKFDLSKWNPDYFNRLKHFIELAHRLDIIVEVTFFSSTYQDTYWKRNPFNPRNNINNIPPKLDRKKSNTLANRNLTDFQKKLVVKLVTELNEFDNVFYEIQNEPWSDDPQKVMRTLRTHTPEPGRDSWYEWAEKASDASLEWQRLMAKLIVDTEKGLTKRHLIAQNFTNFKHSMEDVDSNISILNFHYGWPEAVWMNYGWNRPVSFDESGFSGSSDTTYLRQAWQFMMAGGAVFNNLDYSFFVEKEDGTGINIAPDGGSANFRNQLTYLRSFLMSLEFIKMKPDFSVIYHSPGVQWQAISEPGKQYAIVFTGISTDWVKLNLPKGKFIYEFISPFTGDVLKKGFIKNGSDGIVQLDMPQFDHLVALTILK